METRDIGILAGIIRTETIGPRTLYRLLPNVECVSELLSATPGQLHALGAAPHLTAGFVERRKSIDAEKELALLGQHGISALAWTDEGYPVPLREIGDHPLLLFYKGSLAALQASLPLAVVGTRHPSPYGMRTAKALSAAIARAGGAVVSGLALGIDAAGHESCLDAGGTTIAVVGSGLDDSSLYPGKNRGLAQRIAAVSGIVMSEWPPGVPGVSHRFPRRNRIVAGLCRGTVVVEAPERSGSLITARLALEYGRDVFAVPGPIDRPESAGANRLISEGATVVLDADTILTQYPQLSLRVEPQAQRSKLVGGEMLVTQPLPLGRERDCFAPASPGLAMTPPNLTPEETRVYHLHALEQLHPDEVARRTGLPISEVLALITMLELRGCLRR